MNTQKLVPSKLSIVTASDVRDYLRFGESSEDTLIEKFISAAIDQIEAFTGLSIAEATFKSWTDSEYGTWVRLGRTPLISISRVYDADADALTLDTDYQVFEDLIYANSSFSVHYKAGILRPATATGNTVTLTGHGYSVDDEVIIDGISHTVLTVPDVDSFTVTSVTDGSKKVGYLSPDVEIIIIQQAANLYLRGSTEPQLSKEMMRELRTWRKQIAYSG